MTPEQIDATLDAAEASPARLNGIGYWDVVAAVKRDPSLVEPYADRIGAIDQAWFRSAVPIALPLWLGTAIALGGTLAALVLIGIAYRAAEPWNGISFLAGTVGLIVATHGLGHLAVGSVFGIRFTAWFAFFRRPQPGVKIDYASYLRAPARHRAWMHAGGAVISKAIPFVLIPSAVIAGVPWWGVAVLLALAIGQVVTDVLWSTKSSDWSRYLREMAIAREYEP